MYSRLLSVSRGFYLAGIVLALVLVIPTPWFPFQLAKVAVFAACLFVSVVLFIWGGGMREVLRAHGFKAALLVASLPLAYLISYAFSTDKSVALTGFGIETDTVLFVTLLFLAFMSSFALFRTLRTVRLLLTVVFWALVAAAVFQCVSIVFGSAAIPLATFSDRSVNLVGKWNDLGLLVGLLAIFILVRIEITTVTNAMKIVMGLALAALVALLAVINFPLAWSLLLGLCVLLALTKFLMQRRGTPDAPLASAANVPWFALAGVLISILFLFFGGSVNTGLTSFFPVSSLEVRPSYSSTLGVINSARGSFSRTIVGTGPNTFGESWLAQKPAEVNQSAFWNLDFNVGFSTFITALGTVGFLGILAWLVPLLLVLGALVRAIRSGVLNREDTIVATTLGLGSIFLLASLLLYVPSENTLILAFTIAGATFGFLWRQGQSRAEGEEYESRFTQLVAIAAIIVVLLLSGWSALVSNRRLIAEAYVGHGTQALSNSDVATALSDASRAASIDKTGDALRLQVDAGNAQVQQLATQTSTPTSQLQQQFATAVQSVLNAAASAQTLNPQDYRPTLSLAQLYNYLATLQIQGAAATSLTTYQSALAKNPTNPVISLDMARLEALEGDQNLTTQYLSQALKLKPNYTDAILLVVQLDVANNDVNGAIQAATAAAQTAPGVAPIWFELGLLYYSAGNNQNAAAALEQAVSIVPNYANAQYFLGLAYYNLNRTPDAIKEFQALAGSNPGNSEVTLILSNLQSGKKPFDGAVPPITSKPQNRTTAPISQ